MARELRYGGVNIDHPGQRERAAGARSEVWLSVTNARGTLERVPLSEDDLISLIADAASLLRILRKVNGGE